MTDLFLKILNLSFSATWVVLGVVLARLLLKKAPRSLVCALWALVALRLIFGGIEAPVSLLPSAEIIPPDSLFEQAPAIHSGISSIDNAINPVYSESLRPAPGASVNPLQVWLAVYANLWILGMGAMALWAGISCLRVRRQVREAISDDGVYLCDRIASPFIFGLFRPKIYLPSELSGIARAHVVAHERAHIARRDHWWKPLGFLLLTVNWFNPAMWLAYALLCRDIEMACDEKVIRDFGAEEKKAYSAALLGCSINPRPITACPLAFGEVGVKQRVRSVLNYKKPAFWIILLAAVLTIVLAVGLLTDPESPTPEIRWDGILYVQEGRKVDPLPDDAAGVGSLRSILHDQPGQGPSHANVNGQAVHLRWEYAGQPLCLAGDTLYIEEPGGRGWLPFVPMHTPADAICLLSADIQCQLNIVDAQITLTEFLSVYEARQLQTILSGCTMEPSMDWDFHMLANNYAENICILVDKKDFTHHFLLLRREHDWLMVYRDETWAVSAWSFESPEMDAFLAPWQAELSEYTAVFAPFAVGENAVCLESHSFTLDALTLRCAIPRYALFDLTTDTHWEYQSQISHTDKTITIEVRPSGRTDWMQIHYRDQREPFHTYGFQQKELALQNGATGTLYHASDPDRWSEVILDTTRGQLYATAPNAALQQTDWTQEDYRVALTILSTLRLTENGNFLFGTPADDENLSLGIHLQVEDVTANSARLVCTQDGTYWDEIITGAPWNLERLEDGQWVSVMPESTTWTAIAYGIKPGTSTTWDLNWGLIVGSIGPGTYRLSKTFTGERRPMSAAGREKQEVRQTCYAIFEINPLGIHLGVADITPAGATLVCTQDGTDWEFISTGSDWTLEHQTNDGWVSVLPEDIAWTIDDMMVNQGGNTTWNLDWSRMTGDLRTGRYRVGKTFWGVVNFTVDGDCAVGDSTKQTYYAEFLIGDPAAPVQTEVSFSDAMHQALREDLDRYLAMSQEQRFSSSTMPGFCMRDFDDWNAVEAFVGFPIPNPLENLEELDKGCWAGTPVGYNGASRFHITWYGNLEGHVYWVNIESGYRRDGMRVCAGAAIYADPPENISYDKGWSIEHERLAYLENSVNGGTVITEDRGDEFEARTAFLARGPILYSIRVIGEIGTADAIESLLQELLPHFESITTG